MWPYMVNVSFRFSRMPPEIFATTLKRLKLHEEGYVYLFDKMSKDKLRNFWRCEKKGFCPARLHTDARTNEVIKLRTPHIHRPNDTMATLPPLKVKAKGHRSSDRNDAVTVSPALVSVARTASGSNRRKNTPVADMKLKIEGRDQEIENESLPFCVEQIAVDEDEYLREDPFSAKLDRLTEEGSLFRDDEFRQIFMDGLLLCKAASSSNASRCTSLLVTGPENTGKSHLAARIVKSSHFENIRLWDVDSMLGFSGESKFEHFHRMMSDVSTLTGCLVFIDGLEYLLDYCEVSHRYSLPMLQYLRGVLKRETRTDCKLLIIATASEQCAEEFSLHRYFTLTSHVEPLSTVQQIMTVIENSGLYSGPLADQELLQARNEISEFATEYKIPIGNLLNLVKIAKETPEKTSWLRSKLQDYAIEDCNNQRFSF